MATRTARTLAAAVRPAGSDRDLLREFASSRSHPAFAELVRRYGPLVFGVCRRTLNHVHDAEDAFQATFLVLARRAARITAPEKLAGWLHSVAVRTATEIRHMRDKRASRDRQLAHPDRKGGGVLANPDREGGGDLLEQRELAAALDAELANLPDHYRLPVVLCELRGLSRKQAADELKVAEGTLSSRLAKARKLLADRLAKRGFAASVAAVSAALAGTAAARVAENLQTFATDIAINLDCELFSTSVISASDTVVKAMFATKLKSAVLAGGLMAALAGGLLLVPGGAGAQPGGSTPAAKTDPADALVKQLGSPEFADREAAEKKLREMGAKALPAVRAGLKSDSPEVVQRSEKLLAVLRKDDAERFTKAFLADKEFKQKFDHPIWKRWAKVVGDDRGSRELFAEVLGVEGAGQLLDAMADGGKANAELYKIESAKWFEVVKKRGETSVDGRTYQEHQCHLIGEAALLVYLATFEGTGQEGRGEGDALLAVADMPLVRPGRVWRPRFGSADPMPKDEQAACDRMKPAANKLLIASLYSRTEPWAMILGTQCYRGDITDLLPLAKTVCRDKTRSAAVRATVFPLLARFGESDYLPDMEGLQTDRSRIQALIEPNGSDVYFIRACDVAVASQLLLHKQDLAEYGFPKVIERMKGHILKEGWQSNPSLHGFVREADRTAAHAKALAFLKDAPKPEAKKDPEAERLVKQLGSADFAEREAAEKRLREMGAQAVAAVKAGLSSESPEVVQRCERVLAHVRTEGLRATFRKLVGDDRPARDLFDVIRSSGRGWAALVVAAEEPGKADELYATRTKELLRVGRGLPPVGENGKLDVPEWPYLRAPPPVPAADVFAWLFLGTFTSGTGEWTAYIDPAWWSESQSALKFLPEEDHSSAQHVGKEYTTGATAAPLKTLTVKWLEKRREKDALRAGLAVAMRYDIPDALAVARSVLAKVKDETFDIHSNTAAAVTLVGEFGTKDDVPLLLPHLDDDRTHTSMVLELPKGLTGREGFVIGDMPGVKKMNCQIRDLAAVAVLKLAGRDPEASGFPKWQGRKHPTGSPKSPTLMTGVGFRTDEERQAAFEREKVLFKRNPVPKAKPVLPKKLEKMPEAADELRKELHKFDEQYRHGTPEKFAELEAKADELAKKFPEKDDQARIWYEVAHVAAQSDIRKQAERVRKYAPKCLELSRDPLHRAWMYSYLASAEYVADGEFADKRRKGAEWLLTGYAELLAQELPDEKPELPAVNKIGDSDDPAARAKHAALMAAREDARFVQDQVFRRDVLVQQLRDLYKKDPDELRAMAAKKLSDDAAVKKLLDQVAK